MQPVFSAGLIGPAGSRHGRSLLPRSHGRARRRRPWRSFRALLRRGRLARTPFPYAGVEATLRDPSASSRASAVHRDQQAARARRNGSSTSSEWDGLFDRVRMPRQPHARRSPASRRRSAHSWHSESLDPGATVFVGDTADDATAAASRVWPFTFARPTDTVSHRVARARRRRLRSRASSSSALRGARGLRAEGVGACLR